MQPLSNTHRIWFFLYFCSLNLLDLLVSNCIRFNYQSFQIRLIRRLHFKYLNSPNILFLFLAWARLQFLDKQLTLASFQKLRRLADNYILQLFTIHKSSCFGKGLLLSLYTQLVNVVGAWTNNLFFQDFKPLLLIIPLHELVYITFNFACYCVVFVSVSWRPQIH